MSNTAAILIGIAALICLSYLFGDKSDSKYTDKYMSLSTCQDAIKPNLKNPDSAQFDDDRAVISFHDDNKISVYITVRATNSFNAMVPTNYICWVKKQNSRYELQSMEQVNY